MSYFDILKPRNEVLKGDGIQGIIDLENLKNTKRKTLESSPKDFFNLTYPTSDIKYMLEKLNTRFNSSQPTEGLFLFEGFKGSGKSHLQLLIYHLLSNPDQGNLWLKEHNLNCKLPTDLILSINKFTDFPFDSIWKIVFEKLDALHLLENDKLPNLDQLKKALAGKRIVLIFDELEVGFDSLPNKYNQAQNLSFLQMLSEEAQRSDNASVTIFASIYNSNKEPGSTLKRVPRVEIKFSESNDRKMVVLHRLFSNYLTLEKSKVEAVIHSYVNQWKKTGIRVDEKYIDQFMESFPFTPEVIDMLFNRVLVKSFQGNRGPLGLLGRIVQNTYKDTDIISGANVDFQDKKIRNYLIDLDTNQILIQCAENDYKDLPSIKHSKEIVNSTLIATLCTSGTIRGIKDFELARQIIKPGDNYNDFQATLNAFLKFGAYFQHSEDSYFFDTQEKPYAKVEYRSLRIDVKDALDFALERWSKNLFNDSSAVVLKDVIQVKKDLSGLDKNSPRFILSPRRLESSERKNVYNGLENQNLVLLLEPKSDNFNALESHDIIKWAQLSLAAKELKTTAGDYDRKKQYERIETDNARFIDETFKKAGLAYVLLRKSNSEIEFELESVGQSYSRHDVLENLQRNFFPRLVFEEHLQNNIEQQKDSGSNWIIGFSIKEILNTYRKTLSFPVPLAETILFDAIRNLCVNKQIGLSHPRESFCGRAPYYSGNEWYDVTVIEPFIDENEEKKIFQDKGNEKTVPSEADTRNISPNTITGIPEFEEQFNVYTTNVTSIGELRQDIALKLNEKENARINSIRFTIYLEKNSVEISTIPASIRGSLNGQGDLTLELNITKTGLFNKSQAEQLAEQLPMFQDAVYKAVLKGSIKLEDTINEKG